MHKYIYMHIYAERKRLFCFVEHLRFVASKFTKIDSKNKKICSGALKKFTE